MKNIIKEILISQMSFPLEYKNEKEIWWEDKRGDPITIKIIDIKDEKYVVRKYHDNGQLQYKRNYHKGQLHGKCLRWYSGGQLYNRKNYYQGQLHGEYLAWWNNGQLSYKASYHQGERHGECLWWRSNGKPSYKAKYNHGEIVSEEYY